MKSIKSFMLVVLLATGSNVFAGPINNVKSIDKTARIVGQDAGELLMATIFITSCTYMGSNILGAIGVQNNREIISVTPCMLLYIQYARSIDSINNPTDKDQK